MEHPFRNAAFGGFNRQDVLDYLEKTAADNAQRQQQLQQQLQQAMERAEEAEKRAAELEERIGILNRDREAMSQELEQLHSAVETTQDQEVAQQEQLDQLTQERDQLRGRVEALEPDAAAYAAVKDRTAGVELEAHCRAQAVQNEARRQADQVRRQAEEWLRRVERDYGGLRSQVEATVSHAADELDKAGRCLEEVTRLLGEQESALEELSRGYSVQASELEASV